MAVKPFVRTSTLQQSQPIVDKDGRPAAWFVRLINDNNNNVTEAINQIAQLPIIRGELEAAIKEAKDAAQAAQDAADGAASSSAAQQREIALQSSYIDPKSVVSANPTTITIAPHTRYYPQPSGSPLAVSVAGGTAPASAAGETDYVSYVDPERDGGTVTYIVSTTQPTQTGDTHVVGAVVIPATGTQNGGNGPLRPGEVQP